MSLNGQNLQLWADGLGKCILELCVPFELNAIPTKSFIAVYALFNLTLPDTGLNSWILDIGNSDCSQTLRLTIKNSISILSISTPNCLAKKYL